MDAQQKRSGAGGRFNDPAADRDDDAAAGNGARHEDTPDSPGEAFKAAFASLGEVKDYAAYFVGAKWDGIKVSLRNLGVYAALGLLGLAAGMALLATTVVLLLTGLAGAVGAIGEKDRPWLGALIVGGGILVLVAVGVVVGMKWLTNTTRKQTVDKYERRQREQRNLYGHDVRERATERELRQRADAARPD